MKKQIAKAAFYAMAVGVFLFTASMTFTFVSTVIPEANFFTKAMSLVIFDGGMLAWMLSFTSFAQGITQRTTSICMCFFDFAGVGLMVAAEVVVQSGVYVSMPIAEIATVGVFVSAIVNAGALLFFHLNDPETRKEMAEQARLDKLDKLVEQKLDERADSYADALADRRADRDFAALLNSMNLKVDTAKPAPMLRANAYTVEDTQPLPVVAKPTVMAAESPTSSAPRVATVDDAPVFSQASLM